MRSPFAVVVLLLALPLCRAHAADYVVVASAKTQGDAAWSKVTQALQEKHGAKLLTYDKQPVERLDELRDLHPRHTCFVAQPGEATREFVAAVHQLTRKYDDDPYADTFWGILTGYDAANALAIARHDEPLTVRKVASGTELALEMCEQGQWYDELVKNKWVMKEAAGEAEERRGPDDTTQALVDSLNDYQPDLFVTSGHATERNWMIGFRYQNGFFKSKAGQMYGEDTQRKRIEIDSPNAKIYLPIGNCLMGHIDGPDAMALAWMNDVGVKQMIGYTVPTWFGYAGWGVLDYFVEQPGRYTLSEAFFANQHALIHNIETKAGHSRGMLFDRDVVAFYGDPAWPARMAEARKAYQQELAQADNTYTLTIVPQRGSESFQPVNTNGAQRGWRPIVQFLPHRVRNVKIIAGDDLKPVVTDDFILIPNPRECDPQRDYRVVFTAESID